jgi:alpha-L-arabinofuranosidase
MAGMEKNSDMVPMNSYAPIFVNVNDRKWNPDMIVYNASTVYCTPSYYVQKMFAANVGTVNIQVNDTLNTKISPITGAVGLGTWSTKADYSNVTVTNGASATVFSDLFGSTANWTQGTGTWAASGGVYSQTATSTDCRSIAATISDTTYTYSLKARKVSGAEGFLIIFGYKDANNYYWWNIGGWANTQHAIEQCTAGSKVVLTQTAGSVTTGAWNDIRIEVSKTKMLFYLNNVLIHTLNNAATLKLYTSATLDEANNQLYLKVINPDNADIIASVDLKGASANLLSGKATVLSSTDPLSENTLTAKTFVAPVETTLSSLTKAFNYTFKSNSVTVLQLNTSSLSALPTLKKKGSELSVFPNPAHDCLYVSGLTAGKASLEIHNLQGQSVLNVQISTDSKINVSELKSGVYTVDVHNGNRVVSTKLIKE